MKDLPKKKLIIGSIVRFFAKFKDGDVMRTEDIIKFVKRDLGITAIYGDTVLRYARQLRQEGRINYTCLCKSKRTIKIIK